MPSTRPQLRECPGCGLLQQVPELDPGGSAHCARCPTVLRRVSTHQLQHVVALAMAALILLIVMCSSPLMSVETAGIRRVADLFSGPEELVLQNMAPLAVVVLFVTVVAPLVRLAATLYVLIRAHEQHPPRHLRRIFALAERLRPWSMVEVFVLGVFVAYVKLGDLVTIGLRIGVYALLALTIVLVWLDSALDREAVWERLDPEDRPDALPCGGSTGAVGCETCGLVSAPQGADARCPRCGSALHARRPNSIQRTWALIIAAAILYIPANYYPVLSIVQLGAGQPSTILGGVEELVKARQYPLAALVFFASIAVPMLKLIGLSIMLIATQAGRAGWLRDRTRLYHIVRFIGRWSMIDIFMESLLGALVAFGAVITIQPGMGALAFCAVVILTMFAAETFDPRLMWDAAAEREPTGLGVDRKLAEEA
ncbi:MAG: paraquat-inducible protein A [Alphaproteobacteria bacterium]|nr:paraquat-inducible protein A [Alphaproteobacteria bacterium]